MKLTSYLLKLILLLFLLNRLNCLQPTRPILVSPNTQSSPSNFIFYFELQNAITPKDYLMIVFSPLSSAKPLSCLTLGNSSVKISQCVNLNTASINQQISVNTTWINSINPNIDSTLTVIIQFTVQLEANTEYSIQIITDNVLPAIGSITSSIQFYTITSTGFMLQQNWNFGQVFFQFRQNNILSVTSINSMTANLPGTLFSNLLFQITVAIQCPTSLSRLKLIISGDFQFSQSSLVNSIAVTSTAPQILSTEIISPNIIITTFNESFSSGRKFRLSITDILNPLSITSGFVSVYYLPYNSMSPISVKQLAIPISTIQYTPTLSVLTGQGITPFQPVQFYTQNNQYITVTIILPRTCDQNFVIQIETDTLTIQQGSVYAITSTVQSSSLIYNHYTQMGVQISGFPQIPSGSLITVTMMVWIPNTPSFSISVSIDKQANLDNPIIYGTTVSSITTVVPTNFVSGLTGTQLQPLKLSSMITASTSNIQFTVTPSFSTSMGSSLTIYTSKNLIATGTFSSSTSCLVNSVAATCTITTNSTLTKILIMSGSSSNLFSQSVATPVVINNIKFLYSSSTTQYIHQLYFMLTVSQATNAAVKKMVIVPQVIPQRNTMASFSNYFCNDLNNTGTNYPNIFRIVSSDFAQWQYTIQSRQRRLISIFAKNGWTNLFSLSSGETYPILSSMTGVTSTYVKGTTYNRTDQYPLNWDKIDLILPGTQSTTKFSVAIPTTYISATSLQFEILIGIYNIDTRLITYLYIQPRPVSLNPTFRNTASAPVSSKPKQLSTKIQLAGFAGSYKNSVQITVAPASGTFSGTTYSTSLIILSTWPFFDSTSTFSSSSLASANPLFQTTQQTPLSIPMEDGNYLTFIPFKTTGVYASQFSIYLDSIKLPYSFDLPYYSICLIDETGSLDSYNEFINQDQGVFYLGNLKQISFQCSDNSLGTINTDCTINFTPYQQLQIYSTIYVALTGLAVSTDQCILKYVSNNTQVPLTSCVSNTDKNQIIITLANTVRLSGLLQYSLQIFGMAIQQTTMIHYVYMSIRDPSGSYIVEQGTRILMTTVSTYFPIYIDQVTYFKNNPIVVSGFFINFQLPRNLYQDQLFAVVLSNDLSNLNSIPSKMKIHLFNLNNNTQIENIRWFINSKNYQIVFQDLHSVLGPFNYRLEIYGIQTPSSISTDTISLIFMRFYDNTYTVQNNVQSTSQFPGLVDKLNSLITFQSFFNTEGLQQPLTFTIQPQYAIVNDQSIWYISLPRYYSQDIWNQNYLIYCRINEIQIQCGKDPKIPYTINIWGSPLIIEIGTSYTLEIYGIVCPRAIYLNGNANYVTQSIFFGMAQNSSSQSYVQYSQLFMTTSIIDPQTSPGYGSVIVSSVVSSNSQTFQTTFFSVNLVCNVAISSGNWIYLQFPEGFDNFNDISMQGNLIYLANTISFNSQVSNVRVGFQVSGINIPTNAQFTIEIASLPTPKNVITIDMNKLKVIIASSDKSTTIASTLQLHNQASSISFTQSGLHLAINNDNMIQITAGTYSQPIKIYPSDYIPFLSNIKVQFISTALQFSPQPAYLLQGNSNGQFIIGADQTIIPTIYNYQIIKSQTSISAYYTALSLYAVKVTNHQISIAIPNSIVIPLGGCSIPIMISIDNPPYSDISINFQYDSSTYTLDLFWINQETSYNTLDFTTLILQRQLSFCTSSTFTTTTFPVNVYLDGSNKKSYNLSNNIINIIVSSNSTTAIAPTVTLTTTNVQKTFASFNLNVNLNGFAYYQLNLAPFTPLDLITLKQYIKQENLTLESQKDFITSQIYVQDRDYRVNLIPVVSGQNQINFQNLLPERSYTLCVWFQNQHRVFSQRVCNNFTLQSWGNITKFNINFNSKISQNQLNNILCFFSKASNSKITQVMDLQGKSCSLNSSATNYNYNYKGITKTLQLSSTILYHISDYNLTTDPSTSAFKALYNSVGILQSTLDVALSNFSINYISSSALSSTFQPLTAINIDSSNFMPILSYNIMPYISQSYTQQLRNMKLSQPGIVYLILTSFKTITKDQITGHTDINIRPIIQPSSQQILNCLDGYGQAPIACSRIVLKPGDSLDASFSGLNENNMYSLFYVVANEYPLRPITYGNVKSEFISTIVMYQTFLIIKTVCFLTIIMLMIA